MRASTVIKNKEEVSIMIQGPAVVIETPKGKVFLSRREFKEEILKGKMKINKKKIPQEFRPDLVWRIGNFLAKRIGPWLFRAASYLPQRAKELLQRLALALIVRGYKMATK